MDEALMDDSVSRIMFDFQSPGGTVGGIPELGRKIANSAKPTIGWTDSQCCSGAYWLASQCERFYTSESCDVGSIGVYMALLDESRALENEGIKINAISAGKFKLAGAPFKPLTDEERKMFQAGVDKIYTQFKEAVSRNRSLPDSVMQGQVYDGQEAADLGLSDGMLENIQEALDA
jgi:protease-4